MVYGGNVMTDFQKAIDTIVEAFEELAVKFKEMADTLNKAFGFSVPEKEKKKSLSSPARYGMSLKKFRRESFINNILTVRLLGNIYLTRGETIKNVCTKLEGG